MIQDLRACPWLQETRDDAVWSDWGVAYRDVVILDTENIVTDAYNLTEHDLSQSANRETPKRLLRKAALPSNR